MSTINIHRFWALPMTKRGMTCDSVAMIMKYEINPQMDINLCGSYSQEIKSSSSVLSTIVVELVFSPLYQISFLNPIKCVNVMIQSKFMHITRMAQTQLNSNGFILYTSCLICDINMRLIYICLLFIST